MAIQLTSNGCQLQYAAPISPYQAGTSTCTPLPGSCNYARMSRLRTDHCKTRTSYKRLTRRCWAALGKAPASENETGTSADAYLLKAELLVSLRSKHIFPFR